MVIYSKLLIFQFLIFTIHSWFFSFCSLQLFSYLSILYVIDYNIIPTICNVIVAVGINAAQANNGNIPLKVNYPINKIINGTSFPFYSQPLLNSTIYTMYNSQYKWLHWFHSSFFFVSFLSHLILNAASFLFINLNFSFFFDFPQLSLCMQMTNFEFYLSAAISPPHIMFPL